MVRHQVVGLLSGLDMDAQTLAEGDLTDTDWREIVGECTQKKDIMGVIDQVESILWQFAETACRKSAETANCRDSLLKQVEGLLGLEEFNLMKRLVRAIAEGDCSQATMIARKGNPVRLWLRRLDDSGLLEARTIIKDSNYACEA